MADLLKSALDALREGVISPITFAALLLFGLIAWLARKGGEKMLASIAGLLREGEKLRTTLHDQLEEANERAILLQEARDAAVAAAAEFRVQIATLEGRLQMAQARTRELELDLQSMRDELHRANMRNPT